MQGNQFINQATQQAFALMRNIADGSVSGTTNDAVLRYNPVNDVTRGEGLAITHDAVNGDSVAITRSGIYALVQGFSQAASNTVILGLSFGQSTALNANPAMATAGVQGVGGAVLPAATTLRHVLTSIITVTAADAANGLVARALGTNGANAVIPDASIEVNDDCYFRVTRIGNIIE